MMVYQGRQKANGVEIAVQRLMIQISAGGRVSIAIYLDIKLHITRTPGKKFLELEELLKRLEMVVEVEQIHQN